MVVKQGVDLSAYGFFKVVNIQEQPKFDPNFTDAELEDWKERLKEFNKNYVVEQYDDPLDDLKDHWVFNMGHSRRGQHYYLAVNSERVLFVFASKPDGSGGKLPMHDVIMQMFADGIIEQD